MGNSKTFKKQNLLGVGLIFLMGGACMDMERVNDSIPPIFKTPNIGVSSCVISEIKNYSQKVTNFYDRVEIIITDQIDPGLAAYFSPPIIIVNQAAPNQLAAIGHELVRAHCLYSSLCDWRADDTTWTGEIGKRWNEAEDLANQLCGGQS